LLTNAWLFGGGCLKTKYNWGIMIIKDDEEKLRSLLTSLVEIPSSEWEQLRNAFKYRELNPGDYFVRAGDAPREIGFVLIGLLRKFYETDDGRVFIKDFSFENRLASAYSSLILGQSSRFSIQAIEHAKLLTITFSQLTALYNRHPCWQELGRRIAETLFIEREQREWELLAFKAAERYEIFKRQFPNLTGRVPQYDIASYLGISPVSLSRLIGAKKKSKK
jgi:CRP-like cAMP-binding protein